MQGGGHGPWTTVKGMAADTVLELEVVTAAGDIVTANADTNSDLFWALRGGGPSAFGVVLSATFQTFTDVSSAGASLDINRSHTSNQTLMWEAITIFHGYANHFVDNGLYVYFEASAYGLHVRPFVAIGQTTEQLDNIIAPLLRDLDAIGLRFSTSTRQYDTFLALYNDLFEPEGAGISALTGGWVFAHRDISQNNTNIINSYKNIGSVIGHMWNPAYGMPKAENALNPRFRDASVKVIAAVSVSGTASWEQKMAAEKRLTFDVNQKLKEAGPAGLGYVNEVSVNQSKCSCEFVLCLAGLTATRHNRVTRIRRHGRMTSTELIILAFSIFGRNGTLMESSTRFLHRGRRTGKSSITGLSYARRQVAVNWMDYEKSMPR